MKKVLIMIDTSRLTGRELLSGAERYISAFTKWEVHTLPPNYLTEDAFTLDIKEFDGFFVCYTKYLDRILKTNKPKIIHHTPREILPNASLIVTSSSKIGDLAANYFLSLGFTNYSFCGFKNISWSDERHHSYQLALCNHGIEIVPGFIGNPSRNRNADRRQMMDWLKNLPRPIGVFGCNDDRAIDVLEACKSLQIKVPEDVAVLGVDNDKLICNLSSPPLSSISLNFETTGYLAAEHLDRLMRRQTQNKILAVDPTEVVTRRSTDILAIEDAELVEALRFIRQNFEKPIRVSDVVKATTLSRRELEYRFKIVLKKTIRDEIERLRIDYIKRILVASREPVYKIASRFEFTDSEHFSRYFKSQTGTTPSLFRQTTTLHRT